jgi:hypothetical protein
VQFYLEQGWQIAREFAHLKYHHAMLELAKPWAGLLNRSVEVRERALIRRNIAITLIMRPPRACKRTQKSVDRFGLANYSLVLHHLFAAFAFAHRARCAAAILFRAATDIVRFLGIATTFVLLPFALAFAHRAFWAAAILARPVAESLRVPPLRLYAAPKAESAALMPFSSRVKRSCSFFRVWTTPASLVI